MTGGGLSGEDREFIEERGLQVLDKPLAIDGLLAAVRVVEKSTRAKRGVAAP
jgi:hypothetical protein